MHDHAESERQRQEYERRYTLDQLEVERQVNLILEGAIRRIADNTSGAYEIAKTALSAAKKLRAK